MQWGWDLPLAAAELRPCKDPAGKPPEHLRSLGAQPPRWQHGSSAGWNLSSGDEKPVGNAGPNGANPLNTPVAGGDPGVPHAAGVSA